MLFNTIIGGNGGGTAVTAHKITLTAAGWSSTNKTQSVTLTGVLADEDKQLIIPMPTITNLTDYNDAGVQCTGQAANALTFSCDNVPAANIEVYIVLMSVTLS